jgi:hypothetical protein
MGSFGTDFVTGCRETGLGYPFADQFDADVATRFTYETFHTSDGASDGLFVTALDLRFQSVLY